MRILRNLFPLGGALLFLVAMAAFTPALADVDVVIGYETRCVGEIDECG